MSNLMFFIKKKKAIYLTLINDRIIEDYFVKYLLISLLLSIKI